MFSPSVERIPITHIWSECKKSFDQNVQYWEPFTRWPFHFSWIKIKTLRLGKKTNMIFSQCPSISRCQLRWCHCVSTSAATLPWAGGRFLFMLLLCKDLQAIGTLKKHLQKNHSLLSLICLLTKKATRNFLILQWRLVAKKRGYRRELAGVFGSNIPLALPMDPWKFHINVLKGKKVC